MNIVEILLTAHSKR